MILRRCFPWSTQGRTGQPYPVLAAILPVFTIPVNLVGMYRFRVHIESFMVFLNDFNKINAFIEVVPTDPFGEGISVNQTDGYLGAKLGIRYDLATLDRTNMRLRDADNPIFDAVNLAFC